MQPDPLEGLSPAALDVRHALEDLAREYPGGVSACPGAGPGAEVHPGPAEEAGAVVKHVYGCGHTSHLRESRCPGCGKGLLVQRHADHDPSLLCRPAGFGLCELAPLIDYLDRRAQQAP